MQQISYNEKNALYLIPTPIGNKEDITLRALDLLKKVDFILCEDTRTTSILLKMYDIKKKLVSCHLFNEDKVKEYVLEELKLGKNIGLVTDQGSPIISDPGNIVTNYIIHNGYNVIALPGATAFVPAIMTSGLDARHFLYYGFLNSKNSKQKKELELLKNIPWTMIFYEAPHRLDKTLENMLNIFGPRKISVVREISKIHEEIIRTTLDKINEELKTIKGEFVIIVEGNNQNNYQELSIMEHINLYLNEGISEMDAIKKVSKERNIAKSVIYKEFINNKKRGA